MSSDIAEINQTINKEFILGHEIQSDNIAKICREIANILNNRDGFTLYQPFDSYSEDLSYFSPNKKPLKLDVIDEFDLIYNKHFFKLLKSQKVNKAQIKKILADQAFMHNSRNIESLTVGKSFHDGSNPHDNKFAIKLEVDDDTLDNIKSERNIITNLLNKINQQNRIFVNPYWSYPTLKLVEFNPGFSVDPIIKVYKHIKDISFSDARFLPLN